MPRPEPESLPGGAPIKKKRKKRAPKIASKARSSSTKKKTARKTAAVTLDETPPKRAAKKKTARTKTKKEKPPCKYGPRTASGKCPKKPTKFVQRKREVTAIVSPKSTKRERSIAAQQLGAAVATEISREALKKTKAVLRSPRQRKAHVESAKQIAKIVAPAIVRALPVVGAGGALVAGASLGRASVKRLAEDRVRKVEQTLGRRLDAKMRSTLLKQHEKQARKELTIRPSLTPGGK